MELLWIAVGGMLGALSRYAVGGFFQRFSGVIFPWGTFSVNVIGSFIIGLLWGLMERFSFSPSVRAFVFIGFLGAFTTFSSYSLETINMLREGEYLAGGANFILNNFVAFLLTLGGIVIAHYFVAK